MTQEDAAQQDMWTQTPPCFENCSRQNGPQTTLELCDDVQKDNHTQKHLTCIGTQTTMALLDKPQDFNMQTTSAIADEPEEAHEPGKFLITLPDIPVDWGEQNLLYEVCPAVSQMFQKHSHPWGATMDASSTWLRILEEPERPLRAIINEVPHIQCESEQQFLPWMDVEEPPCPYVSCTFQSISPLIAMPSVVSRRLESRVSDLMADL